MFLVCTAVFCQMITFNDTTTGWAECTGTKQQTIKFYEAWKHQADPQCDGKNRDWWVDYDRIHLRECDNGVLYYANTPQTRSAVIAAIIKTGSTVRFKVTIAPFGSFYVYYNPWIHSSLTAVILLGVGAWIRRSVVRRSRPSRIA